MKIFQAKSFSTVSLAGNWHNSLKRQITLTQNPPLSKREQEVVQLLLEGKSNKLIASSLSVSERTVEFHLKNIFAKFQVSSRVELILKLGKTTGEVESEKLGQSTVDNPGKVADNSDKFNSWMNWAASFRDTVSIIGKELKMDNVLNSNARNGVNNLTFFESIRVCLTKYAEFNGRASRSEFWWFALFIVICVSAITLLNETIGEVFLLATLLPLLAAGSRRLHDSGNSAWLLLYLLVPIAGVFIVGIYYWVLPSIDSLSEEDTRPA